MSTVKIEAARANGILYPELAWAASREAGIPFWTICAFLEKESSGGRHIYGRDVAADGSPKPFWNHGAVTEANYKAYKIERDLSEREPVRFGKLGRRSQGVGPMQLTFWAIQDRADEAGGCWDYYTNLLTGAQIIKGHFDAAPSTATTINAKWHYAALKYNGKEEYAVEMDSLFAKWRGIIL